jgi:hypothetical protein
MEIKREIKYSRKDGDYEMRLSIDGGPFKVVGYAGTYQAAETELDKIVFEMLNNKGLVAA